ncbi:hypothetical protein D4R99_04555 [bacterium]|nr:MAG: hypothetical protein D4R99_04555 [bacterium]
MKNDKFCFNKTLTYLVLLVLVVVGFFWVMNGVNSGKTSKNTEAAGTCNFTNGCAVHVPSGSTIVEYYCIGKTAPSNSAIPGQVCTWVAGTGYTWVPGPTRWPTSSSAGGQAETDCEKYTGCWNYKTGASATTGYCQKKNTCSLPDPTLNAYGSYCQWSGQDNSYVWVNGTAMLCTRQPTLTPAPTAVAPTRWPTSNLSGGQPQADCQSYTGCWNYKNGSLPTTGYCQSKYTCSPVGQNYIYEGGYCQRDLGTGKYVWQANDLCVRQPTLTPAPTAVAPTRWPTATNNLAYNCATAFKCYDSTNNRCISIGQCAGALNGTWCSYDQSLGMGFGNWWQGYTLSTAPSNSAGQNMCSKAPTPIIP